MQGKLNYEKLKEGATLFFKCRMEKNASSGEKTSFT